MPSFSVLSGRDPMLQVDLQPGDAIVAESNAMVLSDGGVSVEGKMQGGLMSSIARKLFSDESLFQQQIRADKGRPGQVFLAPALPGDIEVIEVGEKQFYLNSGCFMASLESMTHHPAARSRRLRSAATVRVSSDAAVPVSCPTDLPGFSPSTRMTSPVPRGRRLSPASQMLIAALTSRSCSVPQRSQVQRRTLSESVSPM